MADGCTTTYKCYFDGSHVPAMSGCAFFVTVDDQIQHSHVHHEKLEDSYRAEMFALYLLLQYIKKNIEPGSAVEIYGDAKGLLDKMKSMRRRRKRSQTKKLIDALRDSHDLTLTFIPRAKNKAAHKLAALKYFPPPDHIKGPKVLRHNKYIFQSRETMLLDDIIVPNLYLNSQPSDEKYQSRLLFYQRHRRVQKTIWIDANGLLLDGYISYLILKEHGVSECCVDVMKRMSIAPDENRRDLLDNLDKVHTTELGAVRIKRNLDLQTDDVVDWCVQRIAQADSAIRKGKNWYVTTDGVVLTIHAGRYTIITAHKLKGREHTVRQAVIRALQPVKPMPKQDKHNGRVNTNE